MSRNRGKGDTVAAIKENARPVLSPRASLHLTTEDSAMISYLFPAAALVTGSVLTAVVLTLSGADGSTVAKKADRLEQAAPRPTVVDNFK